MTDATTDTQTKSDVRITASDIERTFRVLETIRDDYLDEPEHTILNAAHTLVQEHEALMRADPPTKPLATVDLTFAELVSGTEAERYQRAGYDVMELDWMENGLFIAFEDPEQERDDE